MSTISKEVEFGLAVSGFYGTLTFTALVLVLSFPSTWRQNFYGLPGDLYFDGLVTSFSSICALCVLTSLGYSRLHTVSGEQKRIKIQEFVRFGYKWSQRLLLVVFPGILIPFTLVGMGLVIAGETIMWLWLWKITR
jgi:hypothetical protein